MRYPKGLERIRSIGDNVTLEEDASIREGLHEKGVDELGAFKV